MNNYLRHWGILGMRWGVRRSNPSESSSNRQSTKSQDHEQKVELKKKKISEMSNDELMALNKRMQLEKQYKDLASNDISAGKKLVNSLLNTAVKEVENYAMKQVSNKVAEMLKAKVTKAK
jgi:hypothetical protein